MSLLFQMDVNCEYNSVFFLLLVNRKSKNINLGLFHIR